MPGPPRKPTRLRVLDGNAGKRPLPDSEPRPLTVCGVPRPPRGLGREARRIWRTLAPELHRLGILTVLDLPLFGTFCRVLGVVETAAEALGDEVVTEGKVRGELRALVQAAQQARLLGAEFGLSPAARTRVQAPDQPADSPYERWLKGRKT